MKKKLALNRETLNALTTVEAARGGRELTVNDCISNNVIRRSYCYCFSLDPTGTCGC